MKFVMFFSHPASGRFRDMWGGEFSFTTVLVQKRLAYQFVKGKVDNENEW
jgi:hypothetical protein